jgi:endo-1,3(4)-beta-glucanase
MKNSVNSMFIALLIGIMLPLGIISSVNAKTIVAGSGICDNSFPGTDEAGRSDFPLGNAAVNTCVITSSEAQQGSFSVGYKATFESEGTSVKITFELLDTDKPGVEAIFWKETPFTEVPVTIVSGNIFTTTIDGLTQGETISYACKFAFEGGQVVTKYIQYEVGFDCAETNDTEVPTGFTASVGSITQSSVQLFLNASDNSGKIVYTVNFGSKTATVAGNSGVEKALFITALDPSTSYSFSIGVSDLAGNTAANNPIVLMASTSVDTNTDCVGSLSTAQQGSFSVGYNYEFKTVGSDVVVKFELLDPKSGAIAFLWQETPFTEVQMTNTSGKIFSHTLTNQVAGTSLRLACKFAFEGGLSVTKYLTYRVGDNCNPLSIGEGSGVVHNAYPNPVNTEIKLIFEDLRDVREYHIVDIKGTRHNVPYFDNGNERIVDFSNLSTGMYFIVFEAKGTTHTIKVMKQ